MLTRPANLTSVNCLLFLQKRSQFTPAVSGGVSSIPMNQCKHIRKNLESWNGFEALCGFIPEGQDGLPCDGEEKYREDIRHLQNCESCKSWVKGKIPVEESLRLERIKKYCCPVMYGAIEHEGYDELQIRLINFQGESTWAVTNFESVGGNLLIGYCPWCGTKMPKKKL